MEHAMSVNERTARWYELFSRHAEDLYPGRYTLPYTRQLAEFAEEIIAKKHEKSSLIVAHNYLYPEFHELADFVGDSLGLSFKVRDAGATRVDFGGVFFMGETAKIITGDKTRVFMQADEQTLGCSLVFGTDLAWLVNWKKANPGGILITYINSSARVKAISDYVSTSANTDLIILHAMKQFPGRRILLLPDKFLGYVMRDRAVKAGADSSLVDIYDHAYKGNNASCYVHEDIGVSGVEVMLDDHPDAVLLIHPECGCSAQCIYKVAQGVIPHEKAFVCSTEQMLRRARESSAKEFIVLTELGMVYRLRKELPDKTFLPVSIDATCRYMKGNTLERLHDSLVNDRREIVLNKSGIARSRKGDANAQSAISFDTADRARVAIERMLAIV